MVSSLVPQHAIFEASVNPLPVAGVLVRENANELYQRAQLGGESFNLIRAATNGFQEPVRAVVVSRQCCALYAAPQNRSRKRKKPAVGLPEFIGLCRLRGQLWLAPH